ncbi:MAG TPA: glycosyltransferase family 39 protein [Terriglobia bacterium]|nr:glycosyltransferase family 39 protein [Terriglobia bacterium]
MEKTSESDGFKLGLYFLGVFGALALAHFPLLRLPYFWDEAGYYVPAALDFLHHGLLIPQSTLMTGHTPLVTGYLAVAWWLLGFSPLITRLGMAAFAAATLIALYVLGRAVASREAALWACLLLALSPLFFAQSTLAFLDLPAAFTTTVAVWALLRRRMGWFALAGSLAVLTKETAIVIVPVAFVFVWRFKKDISRSVWWWLATPAAVLAGWAVYYHHQTGFWTGNSEYLQYNLYTTLEPVRIGTSFVRRLYQVFIAGFNWLLVGAALLGLRRMKGAQQQSAAEGGTANKKFPAGLRREFFFLAAGLAVAYIVMLSLVGGAVLARYLLPMIPCFYLALVLLIENLPRPVMRVAFVLVAAGFVAAWFINPNYPFAYENNLAYADFIHLQKQAAEWLSAQPDSPRILTAWPATDELSHPELGYVKKPLRVVGVPSFTPPDFRYVADSSFDLVYLYSRQWDPPDNWLRRMPLLARAGKYTPPIRPFFITFRYQLHEVASFERRGQWVRIYAKSPRAGPRAGTNF